MSEPAHILCPYCGHVQPRADRCEICRGLFEPLSRRATQIAMGPWFIRDPKMPYRPGCSYDVLKKQIQAGRLTPFSILRGPSTHQFWALARHVPGVAHLLGYCHKCTAKVNPTDHRCPQCNTRFKEPDDRNELGLMFTREKEFAAAQKSIEQATGAAPPAPPRESHAPPPASPAVESRKSPHAGSGGDLLDDVMRQAKPSAAASPAAKQVKQKRSGSRVLDLDHPQAPTVESFVDEALGEGPAPTAARTAGSANANAAGTGEGTVLDFSPSESDTTGIPPAGLAAEGADRKMKTLVLLLVVGNIAFFIIFAVIYYLSQR